MTTTEPTVTEAMARLNAAHGDALRNQPVGVQSCQTLERHDLAAQELDIGTGRQLDPHQTTTRNDPGQA